MPQNISLTWQKTWITLFSIVYLAACQSAVPAVISPTVKATSSSTPSPPTTSPSAAPTQTEPVPTLIATLASYPALGDASKELPTTLRPANINAPLSLSAQDHFYFSFPLPAASLERTIPSGRYGELPGAIEKGAHTGVDIAVDIGTPVLAAASGTVLWSGIGLFNNYENADDPYGVAVAIRHDFGYEGQRLYTVYAHMSESLVVKGQRVESGEMIGLSGNTGFSSGPHLHFEVRVGENTIYHSRNPELWIAPPEQSGTLVGQIYTTYDTLVEDHGIQITNLQSGKILWAYSYATDLNVNTDSYYAENFVVSDLSVGLYEVAVPYVNGTHRIEIEIRPGAISFFNFHGYDGFTLELPPVSLPPHLPH
jgi:murein DD-endopeptidase MepM/ murein hydrolase activator NlpD